MKKFFSALLVLVMVLALLPASALASETNVWDAIEPAPSVPEKTNVYPAVGETLPTPSNVETSEGSDANAGTETKVTDTKTEELPGATDGLSLPYDYSMPYAVKVDRTNQVITVFSASSSGVYNVIVKQFICSTGTSKNPTPEGVFTLPDTARKEWRLFKTYNTYVRYAVHIKGNYFFHSLLYSKPDLKTLSRTSLRKLGTPASHGCIRMLDEDVQWMYENVLAGTKVFIMDCQKDKALNKSLLPDTKNYRK